MATAAVIICIALGIWLLTGAGLVIWLTSRQGPIHRDGYLQGYTDGRRDGQCGCCELGDDVIRVAAYLDASRGDTGA
jgi:hypothetical protein